MPFFFFFFKCLFLILTSSNALQPNTLAFSEDVGAWGPSAMCDKWNAAAFSPVSLNSLQVTWKHFTLGPKKKALRSNYREVNSKSLPQFADNKKGQHDKQRGNWDNHAEQPGSHGNLTSHIVLQRRQMQGHEPRNKECRASLQNRDRIPEEP